MNEQVLYYNGLFITMDEHQPRANAMLVRGEEIVAMGEEANLRILCDEATHEVDLGGKCVIPGLNDSHMHLLSFGISLTRVALYHAKSIEEVLSLTTAFIEKNDVQEGQWVVGRGWNHDYFEDEHRFLTRLDLDRISTTHPIALARACGHVIAVNTKALEMAGLLEEVPSISGGMIDVDEAGIPTGILRENALSLIYDQIPPYSDEALEQILKDAMSYANSKGVTSVQTDDFGNFSDEFCLRVIPIYEKLSQQQKMTCRVYEQCLLPTKDMLQSLLSLGYQTGDGDAYFKIGPLKLLTDGSLGAKTAALRQPYADDMNTCGILCYTQAELDELVLMAHEANMQVAIHAIGDLGIEMSLNSIEAANKKTPRKNHRHGVVHCQITDDALLNRFKELDVFAYVQPIFLNYDCHIVESRVGHDLAMTSYAFKTMQEKGIHLGFGTDCPVEPLDGMPNIYCAVTRKDLSSNMRNGFNEAECLSVEDALYAYTMGSAYASFEEQLKGSLSVGKLADFVVLNQNILTAPLEALKSIEVLKTYVGGQLVYEQ